MIDVGVEQNSSADWRMSRYIVGTLRMELWSGLDLHAQVGRRSEQEPVFRVSTDGKLRLGAWLAVECSGSNRAAVGAGAVPLREATAGRRAHNLDAHAGSLAAE